MFGLPLFFADDGSDEKEDGPVDSSNLPDLEYESKNAARPVFAVLDNPEDTWEKVFKDIKKALVICGHNCATLVRGKERVGLQLRDTNPSLPCLRASSAVNPCPHRDVVGDSWVSHHRVYIGIQFSFLSVSFSAIASRRCSF